jgi:hypothetical protein
MLWIIGEPGTAENVQPCGEGVAGRMQNVEAALDVTNSSSRARGNALEKFWGDHQRFFDK